MLKSIITVLVCIILVSCSDAAKKASEDIKPVFSPTTAASLIAEYTFNEGTGDIVGDSSGVGQALNLDITDSAAVQWLPGRLKVTSETSIRSAGSATKIVDAIKASNELSLEVWIKSDNLTQGSIERSRIVSLSGGIDTRDITLVQDADHYDYRLRTTAPNETDYSRQNGIPSLESSSDSTKTELSHVVLTWDANSRQRKIYINGQQDNAGDIEGNASNWDYFTLILANETVGDQRFWLGEYYYLAFYSKVMSESDVAAKYNDGLPVDHNELVALYEFSEGSGIAVMDTSGYGEELNLAIADELNVELGPGYLTVVKPTIIESISAASKVSQRVVENNAISVEAWITPAALSQTTDAGATRIITISSSVYGRNITLGQDDTAYNVRLRTGSNDNGIISFFSEPDTVTTELTHLMTVWDGNSGELKLYLNAVLIKTMVLEDDLSTWNSDMKLLLANELASLPIEKRPWLGTFNKVAFYAKSFDQTEIQEQFSAGKD